MGMATFLDSAALRYPYPSLLIHGATTTLLQNVEVQAIALQSSIPSFHSIRLCHHIHSFASLSFGASTSAATRVVLSVGSWVSYSHHRLNHSE